jgi:hypothetical protein
VAGGSSAPQAVVVAAGRGYQLGGAPVQGSVAAVGLLPSGSAGTAVTYEVTIALPGVPGPYPAGQGASAAIQLADVAGVLTVPTSAVHTDGSTSTVDVLRGESVDLVPVQVGAVGPVRTEIVSGLAAGDEVVIADPSQPLPAPGLNFGGLRSGSRNQGGG